MEKYFSVKLKCKIKDEYYVPADTKGEAIGVASQILSDEITKSEIFPDSFEIKVISVEEDPLNDFAPPRQLMQAEARQSDNNPYSLPTI